jgi:hypothetical protein
MKEKQIRIILVAPEKEPIEMIIRNDLTMLQDLVGGYIECIRQDGYDIIINEEGKLEGLQPNFLIYGGADYVAGTALFAGVDYDSGEFKSLTDEQINIIKSNFGRVDEIDENNRTAKA